MLTGGKWLYRLESKTEDNGLWYDSNNNYVFGIGKLEGCKTKDLPMGYDERYHKDGKNWFSSCSNAENLAHWYSLEDAKNLMENGFVFTRYYAVDFVEYPMETTFLKETALKREEISFKKLSRIWKRVEKMNRQVELVPIRTDMDDDLRFIYYHLKSHKFIERLFNKKGFLIKAYSTGGHTHLITMSEYNEIAKKIRTYGDVKEWMKEQLYNSRYERRGTINAWEEIRKENYGDN